MCSAALLRRFVPSDSLPPTPQPANQLPSFPRRRESSESGLENMASSLWIGIIYSKRKYALIIKVRNQLSYAPNCVAILSDFVLHAMVHRVKGNRSPR